MIDSVLTAFPLAPVIAVTVAAGVIGGFVRGYSGFGFGLAAMPILTIGQRPAIAVPMILLMEIVISLAMLPKVSGSVKWPIFQWLSLGTLIGTPVGLAILAFAPADVMRFVIAALVLVAVVVLWRQPVLSRQEPKSPFLAAAGFVSGLLNGGAAMSAPPVILALLSSDAPPHVVRATIMAFVTISAALGIALAAAGGLYMSDMIVPTLILVPCAIAGGLVGGAVFANTNHKNYRAVSLSILFAVSCVALVSASRSIFYSHS